MSPGEYNRRLKRLGLAKACVGQQAVELLLRMSQQPLPVQMRQRKDKNATEMDTSKEVKPAMLGALVCHNLAQINADRTSYIVTDAGMNYLQKLADARLASPEALGIT